MKISNCLLASAVLAGATLASLSGTAHAEGRNESSDPPVAQALKVHQGRPLSDSAVTPMYMLFGQFISHEINLTPFSRVK